MGKYADALPYQLKTIELQEAGNFRSNLAESYMHTSTIYENLGDYQTALDYYKKFRIARDTLMNLEKDATMSELLTKYETGKKEGLIASQEQVIAQQKTIQFGALGFAGLPGAQQHYHFTGNHSAFYLRLDNPLNFHTLLHKIYCKIMY